MNMQTFEKAELIVERIREITQHHLEYQDFITEMSTLMIINDDGDSFEIDDEHLTMEFKAFFDGKFFEMTEELQSELERL